jgi:uncharacterized membrane protein
MENAMASNDHDVVPSTAAIAGHPIHPMLVPFPIAFLVGALASDLVFWGTGDPFWARASVWLVCAGFVMGVVAAAAGLTDFLGDHRVRAHSIAWVHFGGNALAMLLTLWNGLQRLGDPTAAVLPTGLILSVIVVGILIVTGWLGGELAYRHRIGVTADAPDHSGAHATTTYVAGSPH